jgi:hypothetical protein
MESQICVKCQTNLPIEMYDFASNKKHRRQKCKKCRLQEIQQLRKKKKETEKINIVNKICITCNTEKSVTEFWKDSLSIDNYSKFCRVCDKVRRKKKNTIESTEIINVYCSQCNVYKLSTEFRHHPRSITGYFTTCNACWKPSTITVEKQRAYQKKYYNNNIEKIRAKWKRDGAKINRRIRDSLNHRISSALQSQHNYKQNKTYLYIGCDISYLKKWFEFLFEDKMNWDNYGEWHVDHVTPCHHFDLNEDLQQKQCFNWTNLRPCWKLDNILKGDKIIDSIISIQKQKVDEFIKINPLPSQPGDRVDGID